jgi:hypothetical protein
MTIPSRIAVLVLPLFLFHARAMTAQATASLRYSVQQAGDVVQLADRDTDTVVSIVPSVGNIAFEMNVKGQNVLR